MTKPAKKRSPNSAAQRLQSSKRSTPAALKAAQSLKAASKQARVITLLRSPVGATIASMMKETGWQQHSVRGFLAGVVRKRLKLKLASKKIDGERIYRIGTRSRARVDSKATNPAAA